MRDKVLELSEISNCKINFDSCRDDTHAAIDSVEESRKFTDFNQKSFFLSFLLQFKTFTLSIF